MIERSFRLIENTDGNDSVYYTIEELVFIWYRLTYKWKRVYGGRYFNKEIAIRQYKYLSIKPTRKQIYI